LSRMTFIPILPKRPEAQKGCVTP